MRLAHARTDLALIRTGLTIATFGAGVTELIGSEKWPGFLVNLVTVGFVIVGMMLIQAGVLRSSDHFISEEKKDTRDVLSKFLTLAGPGILQVLLIIFLIALLLF